MGAAMKEKLKKLRNQKGVAVVIVAGLIVMFVAFIALSVDIAHLYVVKNELQNAADAGALAGARRLYFEDGSGINTDANQVAYEAAIMNNSEKIAVEVYSHNTNADDVQRGHWSFATQTFSPSNNTDAPVLWDVSSADLDADPDFVNAVMVRTHRQSSQANSFFARILGFAGFNAAAEAVAYIGFAGEILPDEVDQPIAICRESLLFNNMYQCNIGRMLNSGSQNETHNTAGWTNFSQPCETASDRDMIEIIGEPPNCSGGNVYSIQFGIGIGATGGVQDNTLRALRECFGPTTRTEPWGMTLPVVECPGNNVSNCATVVGTVYVEVVWVSDKDADTEKKFEAEDWPPAQMGGWTCPSDPDCCGTEETNSSWRACCWDDFVAHFNLKNVDDITAVYAQKSIYFRPTCFPHLPTGVSGGQNFGILAEIPVLVN